jgi:transposase
MAGAWWSGRSDAKFLAWRQKELPPGCLLAMEACSGAHAWARRLQALGVDALPIAATFAPCAADRAYKACRKGSG